MPILPRQLVLLLSNRAALPQARSKYMSENTSKDCDLQKQIDELQQKLSQLETDFERKSRNPWVLWLVLGKKI
jgi:hypothetical protein